MAESTQHKLLRVRPPRVKITYDVEIGDAIEKKELPFIIGVLADLSGKPDTPLPPVKERKFVEIDRDNFNDVLESVRPQISARVPNRLDAAEGEQMSVKLEFKHMDDFEPVQVLKQVPKLKQLYTARELLRDLLAKLDGNDSLEALLTELVGKADQQEELKKLLPAPASVPDGEPEPQPA